MPVTTTQSNCARADYWTFSATDWCLWLRGQIIIIITARINGLIATETTENACATTALL